MPGFPSPRAISAFVRLAIVALTLLAILRFLPRVHGEERGFSVYVTNERDCTVSKIDGGMLRLCVSGR